jgi:hypothetical protein
MDSEQLWPDDTIVVLPETPRVRLSPRRRMNVATPGWPPAHITETIRMYHDSDDEDQENHLPQFTMNTEFIESHCCENKANEDVQKFMPPISPSKVRALSPSKREAEEDGVIEIPDSAGLSDETRNAIINVWADDNVDDSGFVDGLHYTRVARTQTTNAGLSK